MSVRPHDRPAGGTPPAEDGTQRLPVSTQVDTLLRECRIVLPGLQVLFGFQLAVVFSDRFDVLLTRAQQELHLLAIALVVAAIAIIMTPAAWHRQAQPHEATEEFVRLATWLLLASMPPLALAICLEFYLVAQAVLGGLAAWIAGGLLGLFALLWLGLPAASRRRRRRAG